MRTRLDRLIVLAIVLGFFFSFVVAAVNAAEPTGKVNVNEATAAQLMLLPGVGEKTADNILFAREQGFTFSTVEDLQRVKGIGPKKAAAMAPYVVFEGETTATDKLGSTAKTAEKQFSRPDGEDQ